MAPGKAKAKAQSEGTPSDEVLEAASARWRRKLDPLLRRTASCKSWELRRVRPETTFAESTARLVLSKKPSWGRSFGICHRGKNSRTAHLQRCRWVHRRQLIFVHWSLARLVVQPCQCLQHGCPSVRPHLLSATSLPSATCGLRPGLCAGSCMHRTRSRHLLDFRSRSSCRAAQLAAWSRVGGD